MIGREPELAVLEEFLDRDTPWLALLLTGGPGIGKTALWERGLRLARDRGIRVLAARPSGAEAELSFAGLFDLLEGIDIGSVGGLPAPQRRALEAALLRAEPTDAAPERFAIAAGFLSVLRSLAASEPLLVAVDDLQWLDAASADVLAFADRRARGQQVQLLLSRRSGAATEVEGALDPAALHTAEVGPLSLGATRRLLSQRLGLTLPPRTLRRLFDATQGNPLLALELGRALAEGRAWAIGAEPPVADLAGNPFGARVAQLPGPARRALLVMALSGRLTLTQLMTVADPAAVEDLMAVSRCAAMTRLASGYDERAAARLADAADSYGELGLRFDRARSLLWLGRSARRARKRTAARRALETASAEFEALGSPGWAGQAGAELDLLGARGAAPAGGLTAAEQRVVELAASGLSNKQIARRLFVAVHTVEVHLAHAYAKLGVRSRVQLASRFASPAAQPPPAPQDMAGAQATPAPQDISAPPRSRPAPQDTSASRATPAPQDGSALPQATPAPPATRATPESTPARKPRIEGFRYRAGRPVVGSLLDMTESWTRLRGRARHLAPALAIGLLLAGTATGIGPAGTPAAAATCLAWSGPPPPSPGTDDNELNGVAVLSPCDAWAVGDQHSGGVEQTLIEHWDGTAWTVVPSPNVAGRDNELSGVRAASPTDIWAVGESFSTGVEQTLILRWDGHTWAQVASPTPGTGAALNAVRTVSTTSAWAVGFFDNGTADVPLILRWNGQKWAQVASPHPGTSGSLDAVAATSASNAWAVGTFFNGAVDQGFILRWNGQKWAQVASPNPGGTSHGTFLNGVAANAASGKAWAAGFYDNGTTNKTLILAWTGTKWVQQASPSLGGASLDSVATTAADNAWAVGAYNDGTVVASLILHWNGTKWAQVGSPDPSPTSNFLFAVAASSASNAWAVGRFTDDSGPTTVDKTFAIHCC